MLLFQIRRGVRRHTQAIQLDRYDMHSCPLAFATLCKLFASVSSKNSSSKTTQSPHWCLSYSLFWADYPYRSRFTRESCLVWDVPVTGQFLLTNSLWRDLALRFFYVLLPSVHGLAKYPCLSASMSINTWFLQANAVSDKLLDLRVCNYHGKNLSAKVLSGALVSGSDFSDAILKETVMTKVCHYCPAYILDRSWENPYFQPIYLKES